MPRRMKPEEALTLGYPAVAATWHPDRNGDRTPENTSAKNGFSAWWRCPAGHEWQEVVATRTSLPAWKDGDPAACRVCTGYHVIVAFDCGHTTDAPAQFAEPERGCPSCRKVRQREREAASHQQFLANSAAAKKGYAECRERAEALADSVELPDDLPAPLRYEWRRSAVHNLRSAIVNEELFGKTGLVGSALAGCRGAVTSLVPSVEDLHAAVAARQPVPLLGKAHWPAGWLHYLGAPSEVASVDVVEGLRVTLVEEVGELVNRFGRDGQLRVDEVTRHLTETIADWAYGQETKWRNRRWNVYRELSVPITPGVSTRFGRIDLTAMRPYGPDIVVEIDSAHNDHSIEKLTFARDAGAVAVWVRWHAGRVNAPAGVGVIDLVDATRRLAA